METARVKNKYPECHECGGIRQDLTGVCKWHESAPWLTGTVWRFRKSQREVNGKLIKAIGSQTNNAFICSRIESSRGRGKVIMTALNLNLFFSVVPVSWLKWCTDEPCVIVRCFFVCHSANSDLRHIEQGTARLHLCLISYWLRPSSKWHIKLLDYCCRYWTKNRYTIKSLWWFLQMPTGHDYHVSVASNILYVHIYLLNLYI